VNAPPPNNNHNDQNDDHEIAVLLAQLKAIPSRAARERVFASLQEEFSAPRARTARRIPMRWAMAASAAVVLLAGFGWRGMPAPELVARAEALDGRIESRAGNWLARTKDLAQGEAVSAGSTLDVGEGAGVLLRVSPDLTVRLAENTRARFKAADELELTHGQAFIDARPGAQAPLRVLTPYGEVTHLGTQYQVRAGAQELEIAVREGRAQLKAGQLTAVTEAGHWLLRRAAAAPLTGELASDDPRFEWIGTLPSEFKLEGATLASFLAWFQRETGIKPIYSDGIDAGKFAQVQLKGSIEHLEPFEALSYVLATADLAWHREGAKVIIEKRLAGTG
jgi:ferric-dicitrate binding protein FerR (iron transport regulator)